MSKQLDKKHIITKTAQISLLTIISRIIAIVREILQVQFLGVGVLSDAFVTAFRIPNFFRHIFSEGALNASFIPVFLEGLKKEGQHTAQGVITLMIGFFQIISSLLYAVIFFYTESVVHVIAPGFIGEQLVYTSMFLKILFLLLSIFSITAVFSGVLHSVHNFIIPASGPVVLNFVYTVTLLLGLYYKASPIILCYGLLCAALFQLLVHVIGFYYYGFSFSLPNRRSCQLSLVIIKKMAPCLLGVSIFEINLLITGYFGSFLPKGSVTLLHYGGRLINIPLGIFAIALSQTLLPYFSRIALHAKNHLSFYIFEATKLITFIMIPVSCFVIANGYNFFAYVLLAKKADSLQMYQASLVLMVYALGLVFFALNKIILNVFYALKDTKSVTLISCVALATTIFGNVLSVVHVGSYSLYGIAYAIVCSGLITTVGSFYMLHKYHAIPFYSRRFILFLYYFFKMLVWYVTIITVGMYGLYYFNMLSPLMYSGLSTLALLIFYAYAYYQLQVSRYRSYFFI